METRPSLKGAGSAMGGDAERGEPTQPPSPSSLASSSSLTPPSPQARSPSFSPWPRRRGLLAQLGLLLVALGGVVVFLREMHGHYPIDKWLFWIYARAWGCALGFGAACLCSGYVIVARFLREGVPLRERLLISFAVGVYVFATGVFVAGLFHALNNVFFYAWPLALIAAGAQPLARTLRRANRVLPHARRVVVPPTFWSGVALVFGLAGAALLYINIMPPGNVAFDSRWYHLALAEHYAAAGAVARFPEGWFNGTYPHFASYLYTWAFLSPGANLFDQIELAAHVEYVVFIATLAGVAVLVRWCTAAANVRVRNAWAAVFLFPGILLYDSTLSVAADHVLAFWAPPLFLLLRRTMRVGAWRSGALLGMVMAAAVMTKYQAAYMLAVPALALVGWACIRALRSRGRGAWRPFVPVAAVVAAVLVTGTPLWLKNWIWYGDPVYPVLARYFPVHPWAPGTDPYHLWQVANFTPQGPLLSRIRETLTATVTFSFVSHDWWNHHGAVPIFGSLFTLLLPLMIFVPHRRRVLGVAAATMVGIAVWYVSRHEDRYLQSLLPWMAAVAATVVALVWRIGWMGRAAVAALVAAQVVWGGDVYSIPTHGMLGTQPAKVTLDLLSSGYRKDWASRTQANMEFEPLRPLLPKGSVVLVHERMATLGLGTQRLTDMIGTQGGISYTALGSSRAVHDLLRSFGVTHLVWIPATLNYLSRVDDLIFFEFVQKYVVKQVVVGGFILGELPAARPPERSEPAMVRVQRCDSARTVLLNQLDRALAGESFPEVAHPPGPPAYTVVQSGCPSLPPELLTGYRQVITREGFDMWALKDP